MSSYSTTRAVGALLAAFLLAATALSSATYLFARTAIRPLALSADLAAVEVSGGSGDVAIGPTAEGTSPNAVARVRWALAEPAVLMSGQAGRAALRAQCPPMSVFGGCDASFDLAVRPATEVRVETTSGDITIAGLTGAIHVQSTSGDIMGRGLASAVVAATATSGDVELVFREAPRQVDVEVTSGSIRIALPNDGSRYEVITRTSSGDVVNDVGSDPHSAARIVATATSGDVEITRGS